MKKGLKIALIFIFGLVLLVHLSVQIALNSTRVHKAVEKAVQENVEWALEYSDLRASAFAHFPRISLSVDSLSLLEPKDAPSDTVAAFDSFRLEFNPWQILLGRIRINELSLNGLKLRLEEFIAEPAPEDSVKKSFTYPRLPLVIVDSLSLGSETRISYSDPQTALRVNADLYAFGLSGKMKMNPGSLGIGIALDMDSKAILRTAEYGRMDIPLSLEGDLGFNASEGCSELSAQALTAGLAYLPLQLDGKVVFYPDSLAVDADAKVSDCPVDMILRQYADNIFGRTADFSTDAQLSLDIRAEGVFSDGEYPEVTACLRVPESRLSYHPDSLDAQLMIDLDAQLQRSGKLTASIHEFEASVPGVDLKLDGSVSELLSGDPCYRLLAEASAQLDSLPPFVPEILGLSKVEGDMQLTLDAHTHHSELLSYRFAEADIKGGLESKSVVIESPKDSINASIFDSKLVLSSDRSGFDMDIYMDSVYFNSGVKLIARARGINSKGSVTKFKKDTLFLPSFNLGLDSQTLFLKLGSSRYGVRDADIALRARQTEPLAPRQRRQLQLLNPERDFAQQDFDISLDSSMVKHLRNWSATGHVKVGSGFYASPVLPLRTRITALSADFNDRDIIVDTIAVASGTSDLNLSGYLRGVKRSLMGKGRIESRLKADAKRINVNELVAALSVGKRDIGDVAPEDEFDESFVTDTLADAQIDLKDLEMFVVPGNLDIELGLKADTVNFLEPRIGPLSTGVKIKNGIMQLSQTEIDTEFGGIGLDAFYSTKSKTDISAGVNLNLSGVEVDKVKQVLPSVDSLLPALSNFHGNLDVDLSATAQLDTNMNILMPTLDGLLRVKGRDMALDNTLNISKIAKLILFGNQELLKIDNMQVDALLHDSRLEIFPFEFGIDRYSFALRGTQNFDKTMYYHLSLLRAPLLFRVGVNVYGTLDNWRIELARARYREGHLPAYTKQLDNVQLNLAKSISNIFLSSVDDVMRYNEDAIRDIERDSGDADPFVPHADNLSGEETRDYLAMIDNINFEDALARQEQELMEEVESALEDSFLDTEKLMLEYEDSIYDKKMMRKIERLKRQAERKAAREAKKQS